MSKKKDFNFLDKAFSSDTNNIFREIILEYLGESYIKDGTNITSLTHRNKVKNKYKKDKLLNSYINWADDYYDL